MIICEKEQRVVIQMPDLHWILSITKEEYAAACTDATLLELAQAQR